jgi:hypothetical protein
MRRPDDWWHAIEKALPPHVNRARLRDELDRVRQMQDGLTPEQHRRLKKLEHDLERVAAVLGPKALDVKQACADARRQPRLFDLQCAILWAWDRAGGGFGISTPYKPEGEASWPEPSGDVITFFRVAAKVILGKGVSAERAKTVVKLYRHLKFAVFAGASEMRVAVQVFDADGNEVIDDADRRPKP